MKKLTILMVMAMLAAFGITPTAAQNTAVWKGEYYNNLYLIGDPVATQQYTGLNLNWEDGSPNAAVNADNFTARFSTDVYFAAGTYRFLVRADDGFTLEVDFRPVLDQFNGNPNVGNTYTVDLTLDARLHHIQVDYKDYLGKANLSVDWYNLSGNPSTLPPLPTPQEVAVNLDGGWTAQYINGINLAGSYVATNVENSPNHDWGYNAPLAGIPADNFSARWVKSQYLDGGNYRIKARSDDGLRVMVNGVTYIDKWVDATGQIFVADFSLSAGTYPLVVEYYERAGLANLNVQLFKIVQQTTTPAPTPTTPTSTTGLVATVTANTLNVRSAPEVTASNILRRISKGETYAVVSQSGDGVWTLLNINQVRGWVNSRYITIVNSTSTGSSSTTSPTGVVGVTRAEVNLRAQPYIGAQIYTRVPEGAQVQILGRNAASTWWRASYNGVTGWMSADWVNAVPYNLNLIPVVQ